MKQRPTTDPKGLTPSISNGVATKAADAAIADECERVPNHEVTFSTRRRCRSDSQSHKQRTARPAATAAQRPASHGYTGRDPRANRVNNETLSRDTQSFARDVASQVGI